MAFLKHKYFITIFILKQAYWNIIFPNCGELSEISG